MYARRAVLGYSRPIQMFPAGTFAIALGIGAGRRVPYLLIEAPRCGVLFAERVCGPDKLGLRSACAVGVDNDACLRSLQAPATTAGDHCQYQSMRKQNEPLAPVRATLVRAGNY
jgi:hypothetical protein